METVVPLQHTSVGILRQPDNPLLTGGQSSSPACNTLPSVLAAPRQPAPGTGRRKWQRALSCCSTVSGWDRGLGDRDCILAAVVVRLQFVFP
jgi:hypothetical protein